MAKNTTLFFLSLLLLATCASSKKQYTELSIKEKPPKQYCRALKTLKIDAAYPWDKMTENASFIFSMCGERPINLYQFHTQNESLKGFEKMIDQCIEHKGISRNNAKAKGLEIIQMWSNHIDFEKDNLVILWANFNGPPDKFLTCNREGKTITFQAFEDQNPNETSSMSSTMELRCFSVDKSYQVMLKE